MTHSTGRSTRGRARAPGTERAGSKEGPRVGPLLGAPPPITFRMPTRKQPSDGAPDLFYRVLPAPPGASQGVLELSVDRETAIPALNVVCCVTGVSLAEVAATVLEQPLQVRFQLPDVPGNIRLESRDPADTSIAIQHPPARTRSFGVERMRARRPIAVPKLPPFAGFRRD